MQLAAPRYQIRQYTYTALLDAAVCCTTLLDAAVCYIALLNAAVCLHRVIRCGSILHRVVRCGSMPYLSRYYTLHVTVRGLRIWPPNAAKCCKNASKFFPDELNVKGALFNSMLLQVAILLTILNLFFSLNPPFLIFINLIRKLSYVLYLLFFIIYGFALQTLRNSFQVYTRFSTLSAFIIFFLYYYSVPVYILNPQYGKLGLLDIYSRYKRFRNAEVYLS